MGKTAIFADLNSAQAFDLSRLDSDQVDYYRGVPMTADVNTNSVFLAFRSPYDVQHPNRPYLHLMGYLNSVNGQMPYGITKFIPKDKPYGDIIYEFSNSELASLVDKGLYERDFKVPDKLTGAKLEIPVTCDFALVKPDKETNTVLVYGKIKNTNDLHISSRNTDYVFANDFEKAESLLPHKDVVKSETAEKQQEDELAKSSIDFGKPDNAIDFGDDELDDNPVFDDQDAPSVTDGVFDLDEEDDTEAQSKPDETAETAEKAVQDLPKAEPKKSKEDLAAEKVFRRAQKHIEKRKAEIKAENTDDKTQNKPNKSEKDTALGEQINLQAVRQSKIANEIADDEKRGVVEASVPDTPNDFDAIGDDDYGKHQSKSERVQAERKAAKNGEINEGANKKAMAKHHESHKSIQDLDSPVPVDDAPDDSLDL